MPRAGLQKLSETDRHHGEKDPRHACDLDHGPALLR
jgi:hypothetical protein